MIDLTAELPALKSKATANRRFRFCGLTPTEGVLVIEGPKEADLYLCAEGDEGEVLLANQTDEEAAIYSVRPDQCTCKGFTYHKHCKHQQVLAELLRLKGV